MGSMYGGYNRALMYNDQENRRNRQEALNMDKYQNALRQQDQQNAIQMKQLQLSNQQRQQAIQERQDRLALQQERNNMAKRKYDDIQKQNAMKRLAGSLRGGINKKIAIENFNKTYPWKIQDVKDDADGMKILGQDGTKGMIRKSTLNSWFKPKPTALPYAEKERIKNLYDNYNKINTQLLYTNSELNANNEIAKTQPGTEAGEAARIKAIHFAKQYEALNKENERLKGMIDKLGESTSNPSTEKPRKENVVKKAKKKKVKKWEDKNLIATYKKKYPQLTESQIIEILKKSK